MEDCGIKMRKGGNGGLLCYMRGRLKTVLCNYDTNNVFTLYALTHLRLRFYVLFQNGFYAFVFHVFRGVFIAGRARMESSSTVQEI